MTEKMYDNLQEKYKINVLHILKICKLIILERLVILILIRQLRKQNHWGLCNTLFPNLFSVTTCYMKMRPCLGNRKFISNERK